MVTGVDLNLGTTSLAQQRKQPGFWGYPIRMRLFDIASWPVVDRGLQVLHESTATPDIQGLRAVADGQNR
jgi:hypothetical protein